MPAAARDGPSGQHDGPRAEPAARTPLHVRPCLGRTSGRPIQWSDGWFCDALRIGWLCRLALFAHCCEHICGQRMSVRRRVPCSRAESVHRVGCGVRERLSRSACACSESAWHMCLHSRTAVMTFEGPAARAGKVVRLHTIILWLGPRKVRPISRVGTLLFGPEPRCWTVFVTLQRCYNVTTFVTCVVLVTDGPAMAQRVVWRPSGSRQPRRPGRHCPARPSGEGVCEVGNNFGWHMTDASCDRAH